MQRVFRYRSDGLRPERHEQDGDQPLGEVVCDERCCYNHQRARSGTSCSQNDDSRITDDGTRGDGFVVYWWDLNNGHVLSSDLEDSDRCVDVIQWGLLDIHISRHFHTSTF